MSEIFAWFEIGAGFATGVFVLLVHIAIGVAIVGWHIYEFRLLPFEYRRAWWLVKLAVPAVLVCIVLLALAIFDLDGMAGLAVFYGAIAVSLLTTPVVAALAGRFLRMPVQFGIQYAGSFVVSILVGWFVVMGAANSLQMLRLDGVDGQAEYLSFKYAAEHAPPAGEKIHLQDRQVFRLPSGQRLIHLAFAVDPQLQIHTYSVRTKRSYGGAHSDQWGSTLGTCVTPGKFHMTNILDRGTRFDVRLRFHEGSPESMVEFVGEYEFTDDPGAPMLAVETDRQNLRSLVPLPAPWMAIETTAGASLIAQDLLPSTETRTLGMAPGNDCVIGPLTVPGGVATVTQHLYSTEHYRHEYIRIPIRRADPV